MRVLTTIVSFLCLTLTLWGADTLQYSPYKHVSKSKQSLNSFPIISANTANVYHYSNLKVFLGHAFGKQALSTEIGTLDNFSSSPQLCDAGNLLVSNLLLSQIETINDQFTLLQVPSALESPSSAELAIPPPGDCPLLEALAKDLADPDKGPALNAYLDELLTEGSVRVKAWKGLIDFLVLRKNVGVLEIVQDWSESLILRFKNVGSKHPDFYNKVNTTPAIANYFEEGFPIIKSNGSGLKEVELDMYAWDRSRIDREPNRPLLFEQNNPNSYRSNDTKPAYNNLHNNVNSQSGKISDNNGNIIHTDNVNGEGLMYAVDNSGVIHIGGRGGDNSFAHPNLIGGINPNVKCAGMIKFNQGRILEINNNSGHFKPSAANLNQIKSIFQNKFPLNSTNSGSWDNIFVNVAN